jgi:hypothetical protein
MKTGGLLDVLGEAIELLGPPVKVEHHRAWATFWCPFHDDAARRGERGRPNFGVQLEEGYWKCLRCGASGPSLVILRKKLGAWRPRSGAVAAAIEPPLVSRLNEALSEARAAFPGSPAEGYSTRRGLRSHVTLAYGLGYGVPSPNVHAETVQAARRSRLVGEDGRWLWAGGLVYADPPVNPTTIQVRHLRQDGDAKYQTWGRLTRPLGAWRLPRATRTIVVVEGLLDMLVIAQTLRERREDGSTGVLYTGGASPSRPILTWFAARPYDYLLIPDPDDAGQSWAMALQAAIRRGEGRACLERTPRDLDPDQAVLAGWWPQAL